MKKCIEISLVCVVSLIVIATIFCIVASMYVTTCAHMGALEEYCWIATGVLCVGMMIAAPLAVLYDIS